MQQQKQIPSVGAIVGRFWAPNAKEGLAQKLCNSRGAAVGDDGVARCRACGRPLMFFLKEAGRWLPCACGCAERREQAARQEEQARLRAASGIVGRYARAAFSGWRAAPEREAALRACKLYAARWEQIRERGLGLYLYGGKGAGKTFAACCIGNALLDAGVQVLFADAADLLLQLHDASFRQADEALADRYAAAELVILDNIGSEKSEAMPIAAERLLRILRRRLMYGLPTLFTADRPLHQLVQEGRLQSAAADLIDALSARKLQIS